MVSGLVLMVACSRSPEAQKARYLERGDRYAGREQYREAIIEYRNVLRHDQANVRAIRQLGLMHFKLGDGAQAYPFLRKAEELLPDDLDVRLRLATIYYAAGKPSDARREVDFVLGRDPKNLEALLLLGGLVTSPEEVNAAIQRLETAQGDLGPQPKLETALGTLYVRKGDLPNAERNFLAACPEDPKSVEAHTALGTFYLGARDLTRPSASSRRRPTSPRLVRPLE
jgi:Tfp pilus assembly protein PilF